MPIGLVKPNSPDRWGSFLYEDSMVFPTKAHNPKTVLRTGPEPVPQGANLSATFPVQSNEGRPSITASSTALDWFLLTKPRVQVLVLFTGMAGLLLSPESVDPFLGLIVLLAMAMGSGGSAAINVGYEAPLDAKMERTRLRPTCTGKIPPAEAITFGVVLSSLSVMILFLAAGPLAAGLLLLAILIYGYVYTVLLKPHTVQNIVWGGLAGALPPMIGYAAATGTLAPLPVIFTAIIFLWTPAHFWALALGLIEQYRRAGIPMLPVKVGTRGSTWRILAYSLATSVLGVLPTFLGLAGPSYGIAAALLGLAFTGTAINLHRDPNRRSSRRVFGFSILYLFTLSAILVVDVNLLGSTF